MRVTCPTAPWCSQVAVTIYANMNWGPERRHCHMRDVRDSISLPLAPYSPPPFYPLPIAPLPISSFPLPPSPLTPPSLTLPVSPPPHNPLNSIHCCNWHSMHASHASVIGYNVMLCAVLCVCYAMWISSGDEDSDVGSGLDHELPSPVPMPRQIRSPPPLLKPSTPGAVSPVPTPRSVSPVPTPRSVSPVPAPRSVSPVPTPRTVPPIPTPRPVPPVPTPRHNLVPDPNILVRPGKRTVRRPVKLDL